jgi:hypothetical protein
MTAVATQFGVWTNRANAYDGRFATGIQNADFQSVNEDTRIPRAVWGPFTVQSRLWEAFSGVYQDTWTRTLVADVGTYTYTGNDATLTYTPSGPTYTLTASSGAYTYTGVAAALDWNHLLAPVAGAYTYTGFAANLLWNHALIATAGAYTYTGYDVVLTYSGGTVGQYEHEPNVAVGWPSTTQYDAFPAAGVSVPGANYGRWPEE